MILQPKFCFVVHDLSTAPFHTTSADFRSIAHSLIVYAGACGMRGMRDAFRGVIIDMF